MDRRRFHHTLAWAAAAACAGPGWAQTAVVQPSPTENAELIGIRSVLEVSVPVSYTHLDVYKRQACAMPHWVQRCALAPTSATRTRERMAPCCAA